MKHKKNEMRSLDQLLLPTTNIWGMSKKERKLVLDHWKELVYQELIDNTSLKAQLHQKKIKELNSVSSEYKGRFLATRDVIGLTTTGLVMNTPLLHCAAPTTLICEEAGEVLEVIWNSSIDLTSSLTF